MLRRLINIYLDWKCKAWLLLKREQLKSQGSFEGAENFESRHKLYCDFLERTVRRHPYWLKGRMELGEIYLLRKNLKPAYSESLAADQLSRTDAEHDQSDFLKARVLIALSQPDAAKSILSQLNESDLKVTEHLIAAHMLLDEDAQAKILLDKLPENYSPHVQALKSYFKDK